jgi:hypothetical protein
VIKLASRAALAVALFGASIPISAQNLTPSASGTAEAQFVATPQVEQVHLIRLPAMTEVELTVLNEVSSKTAVIGQPVRLALARPLYVTPAIGLPAGTAVDGYVIHSAKGGMGGKSGELLIGARKIIVNEALSIPLRSFKLGPARGRNNETLAFATAVSVGLPSLLIVGGSAKVAAGSEANAKTSTDVEIPVTLMSKLPPKDAAAAPPQTTQPTPVPGK